MWFRDADPDGRELARECEAFLAGQFVEHLLDRGNHVPPWAWTNLLAHGTEEELRSPATTMSVTWADLLDPWLRARAYLAGEVLDAAHREGSLVRVQRRVLIPLELKLTSNPAAKYLTPSDWVSTVLTALLPINAWKHTRPRA